MEVITCYRKHLYLNIQVYLNVLEYIWKWNLYDVKLYFKVTHASSCNIKSCMSFSVTWSIPRFKQLDRNCLADVTRCTNDEGMKVRKTDHIHLRNRTHAAYHDVDLDGGRGTAEIWPDAVVVAAKQIV